MRISIVTPSLNQAAFLEATLTSVLGQAHPDVEYIVMDGGSNDESGAILERYRHRIAKLVIGPDGGQTDAIAKGFDLASGDILGWLNSDDVYEPSTLSEVAQFFECHPNVRFVFGDATWIDPDGRVLRRKREMPFRKWVWLRTYNYIPQPSAFWRRDLYEEVGGLDRAFDLAMDTDLFARFSDRTRPTHVSRMWSRMRAHPEQKNVRLRARSDREDDVIRRRYTRTTGPRWVIERIVARMIRITARLAIAVYRR